MVMSVPLSVIQEDDRAVDVNVVVAVMQRVHPRQDGQRAAERSENETCRIPPASHVRRRV
jgi:hypothetical protein